MRKLTPLWSPGEEGISRQTSLCNNRQKTFINCNNASELHQTVSHQKNNLAEIS